MDNKIVLSRIDTYNHTEIFDTARAWDRILSLIADDVINMEDEDLFNLVCGTISNLESSAKQDVMELMKDSHIGSMFILEYNK